MNNTINSRSNTSTSSSMLYTAAINSMRATTISSDSICSRPPLIIKNNNDEPETTFSFNILTTSSWIPSAESNRESLFMPILSSFSRGTGNVVADSPSAIHN